MNAISMVAAVSFVARIASVALNFKIYKNALRSLSPFDPRY